MAAWLGVNTALEEDKGWITAQSWIPAPGSSALFCPLHCTHMYTHTRVRAHTHTHTHTHHN